MSEFTGYTKRSLEFLKKHCICIGDTVKVYAGLTYTGIIMPRYEHADNKHIVIKLKNGYNVGIRLEKITEIQKIPGSHTIHKEVVNPKRNNDLPDILLLSTGGTIASRIDYRTGAVTPTLTAQELNDSVPELAKIANIEAVELFSEYSENMTPQHWLTIARFIEKIDTSRYTGIIIAHGTDTMHYTSSFLSFALSGFALPVALVGSQRSSDRASSDAAPNLIGAAKFLTGCKTNGFYIVMHKDQNDGTVACHLGTRVRKNHTSKRGAFETIGGDPAFLVTNETIHKNMRGAFFENDTFEPKIHLDERVVLLKYHPGFNPDILRTIVDAGCRAIIFEGTGLGHIGNSMYQAVKEAHKRGVFMGMTSQCIDGRVAMTVYESGRDLLNLGIVPLDMIPETALVKAMWATGISKSSDQIKEIMLNSTASEFSRTRT